MENENKFPEQKGPEKNSDNAFIPTGEGGVPPTEPKGDPKTDIEKKDHPTTLDKR